MYVAVKEIELFLGLIQTYLLSFLYKTFFCLFGIRGNFKLEPVGCKKSLDSPTAKLPTHRFTLLFPIFQDNNLGPSKVEMMEQLSHRIVSEIFGF